MTVYGGDGIQMGTISAADLSDACKKASAIVSAWVGIHDVSDARGARYPSLASLVKASAAVHRGQSELCKAYSDHLMEGIKAARRGESE